MIRWTTAAPAGPRAFSVAAEWHHCLADRIVQRSRRTRMPVRGRAVPAARALLCAALASLAASASADAVRSFPEAALRGRLEVVQPPAVQLDGRDDRLAMGARIRDRRNLLVTSATLATGQPWAVNYTRDAQGQIGEVWLLTPEEAALPRPGAGSWLGRFFSF